MQRKIILNLATSIDGFIADESGGFDWIVGDGNNSLDSKNKWDYSKFLNRVDTVVMGRNCYNQNFHADFKDKKLYVATTKMTNDYDNVRFINSDICKIILEEKQSYGKDIFLFGGGILLDKFIKEDIIDEYIIGVIPIILGKGKPLFLKNNPSIKLELTAYYIENGVAILHYARKSI
jgi:dihydrofolate reductase